MHLITISLWASMSPAEGPGNSTCSCLCGTHLRCVGVPSQSRGSLSDPICDRVNALVADSAPSQDKSQTEANVWDSV